MTLISVPHRCHGALHASVAALSTAADGKCGMAVHFTMMATSMPRTARQRMPEVDKIVPAAPAGPLGHTAPEYS